MGVVRRFKDAFPDLLARTVQPDQGEKFLARLGVFSEDSPDCGGYDRNPRFLDSAHGKAQVFGLHHHHDSLGEEGFNDMIRQLGGHSFLNLRTAGIQIDHPAQVGKAGHPPLLRDIGDMDFAKERQKMVLAHGVEWYSGQCDHFIENLSFDQGKGTGERGIQPPEEVLIEFRNPAGGIFQSGPEGVFSNPFEDEPEALFNFAGIGHSE